MKITVDSTTRIVKANGIECRVWQGKTDRGVRITCLIPSIAVEGGQDTTQFVAELEEHQQPTDAALAAYPLRMIM